MKDNLNVKPSAEIIEQFGRAIADCRGLECDDWRDDVGEGFETTLSAFDSFDPGLSGWEEWTTAQTSSEARLPFKFFERVQMAKGQQRVELAVMDCGEFRLLHTI